MIFGYYTALERTLFCDHVDDASLDIWEKNVAVHRRGLELIKPGARCKDIALELNDMYREWDLLKYRSFGYGHSFGVLCHYYGREAGVELREDIDTVLEPGMVVSMEPMVMLPEGAPGAGGYREHDILIVRRTAPRTSPASLRPRAQHHQELSGQGSSWGSISRSTGRRGGSEKPLPPIPPRRPGLLARIGACAAVMLPAGRPPARPWSRRAGPRSSGGRCERKQQ